MPMSRMPSIGLVFVGFAAALLFTQRLTADDTPKAKPKRVLSCFNRGCRLLMRLLWRLQEKLSFSLPVEPWPHLPALPVEGGFWGTG